MEKSGRLSYGDLVRSAEDYHMQVFGKPIYLAGEPTGVVLEMIAAIEQYINAMQKSFSGRECLRECGWNIKEHEPVLMELALELAGEREFDDNNKIVSQRIIN